MQADGHVTRSVGTTTTTIGATGADLLGFVASVVGHLAWPAMILTLVLVLRKPLTKLLLGIARFEGFGVKADFAKDAAQFATEVAATAAPPQTAEAGQDQAIAAPIEEADKPSPANGQAGQPAAETTGPPNRQWHLKLGHDYFDLASAESIVMSAWREVERAITRAAEANGIRASRVSSRVTKDLLAAGALSAVTAQQISEARRLRNSVMHDDGHGITLASAVVYSQSARELAQRIRTESMRAQPRPGGAEGS